MELFDAGETFNADYLWFYEPLLNDEQNRRDASEILDGRHSD